MSKFKNYLLDIDFYLFVCYSNGDGWFINKSSPLKKYNRLPKKRKII
jgi:hypothetical protein